MTWLMRAIALVVGLLLCYEPVFAAEGFYATLTATGTTPSSRIEANNHTLQIVVLVSASVCTVQLEGSLDNSHWANLSGAQSCVGSTMFHVDGKPMTFVRANLTAYTGDAAGVAVLYKGAL